MCVSKRCAAALLLSLLAVLSLQAENLGSSVEGRAITVERIGGGERDVLVVGGIHGGYEWNSILLAREVADHYRENRDALPEGITLHVIENMNPDGVARITGETPIEEFDFSEVNTVPGRFNARSVDLNRNWDDEWQPTSYWGRREVDAGSAPFSEPETRIVRDYIERIDPVVVLFFQSAAAGIWYSGAQDEWEPARRLATAYGDASGYRLPVDGEGPVDYEITGAASGYLYRRDIPTIVVELTNHRDTELERNLAGLRALLSSLE
ncbi:MAG: M14 family metallopeptidase [Alkalispirochaetaceae bacterium]